MACTHQKDGRCGLDGYPPFDCDTCGSYNGNGAKYRLVNNHEYDLKGVYYAGLSQKYHDIFMIAPRDAAKVFDNIAEVIAAKEMLKKRFNYNYEIETINQ